MLPLLAICFALLSFQAQATSPGCLTTMYKMSFAAQDGLNITAPCTVSDEGCYGNMILPAPKYISQSRRRMDVEFDRFTFLMKCTMSFDQSVVPEFSVSLITANSILEIFLDSTLVYSCYPNDVANCSYPNDAASLGLKGSAQFFLRFSTLDYREHRLELNARNAADSSSAAASIPDSAFSLPSSYSSQLFDPVISPSEFDAINSLKNFMVMQTSSQNLPWPVSLLDTSRPCIISDGDYEPAIRSVFWAPIFLNAHQFLGGGLFFPALQMWNLTRFWSKVSIDLDASLR